MGPREIIIILLIVVLLFGAPKLPELARSIGKSMRILKDETRSLADDDKKADRQSDAPAASEDKDSTVDLPDDEGRGTK